jgi:hypothetical protein
MSLSITSSSQTTPDQVHSSQSEETPPHTRLFIEMIRHLNAEKPPNAPLVLVIQLRPDPSRIFDDAQARFNILMIAYFYARVLQFDLDSLEPLSDILCEHGADAEVVIVRAHGNGDGSVRVGQSMISALDPSLFGQLNERATILLQICFAGQQLAPQLAQNIPHTIWAAKGLLDFCTHVDQIPLPSDPETKVWIFRANVTQTGDPEVTVFQRNTQYPVPADPHSADGIFTLSNPAYWLFLRNQARAGSLQAVVELAGRNLYETGNVQKGIRYLCRLRRHTGWDIVTQSLMTLITRDRDKDPIAALALGAWYRETDPKSSGKLLLRASSKYPCALSEEFWPPARV